MSFSPGRRRFLLTGALVGGGLLVGYGLFKPRDLLGDPDVFPVGEGEVALNAWLKIGGDGVVTVAVPRAEMGQGVYTSLPMLVAEELDVAWSAIRVEQAPIDSVYGNIVVMINSAPFDPNDKSWLPSTARWTFARVGRMLAVQITGGSTSVRDAWLPMRTAGAAARDMLVRAAAARLEVHPNDLDTEEGVVTHAATGRSLTYGALAIEAARLDPVPDVALKPGPDFRLLGKPVPRTDVPAKVVGGAEFGIDFTTDDLLVAAVKTSPVFGGSLVKVDAHKTESMPGLVEIVELEDAVAVVADNYWHAQQALDALEIEFAPGPHAAVSSSSMLEAFEQALDDGDFFTYESKGDAVEQLTGKDAIVAEYRVPLLAHACMEPMNCSVRITGDRADIWQGNQAPDLLRMIAARRLDLPAEDVHIHTPLLGGGFGRRGEPDVMLRAISIAQRLPGISVKLVYSREEDIQHDTYRPPALSRFRARLDDDGRILAWHNQIASPSVGQAVLGRAFPNLPLGGPDRTNAEGAAFLSYATPHRLVEHTAVESHVPIGFWRSVGNSFNAFFTECFMDELAAAAGADPIDFRLSHLENHPRETRVLKLLRDSAGWSEALGAGHARGVALHESFGSIVGQIAEVSLDKGQIRVHRVVCVIDCGRVVNPDIVIAQMESGIVFGLTAALYGEVRVEGGRIMQWNFPDYRMLSLKEMPRIETHVIESGAEPGGVGEPGTPPIAPAVANAVSILTDKRINSLPIRVAAAT